MNGISLSAICSRCLSWEQWEEETWTDRVTLNVSLEGGDLVNIRNTVLATANEYNS